LSGTQVLLAGEALPLQFAGRGPINALVLFDIPVSGIQLQVERDRMCTISETV
jgi:hypothetical protein